MSMTEALAMREQFEREFNLLKVTARRGVVNCAHYSRTEIKSVSVIDVKAYQTRADKKAEILRKLDLKIQEQNWSHDLANAPELSLF